MKRTTSRAFLFLVVLEQTHDDAPSSSSFPAAPEACPESKPGLVKAEPDAVVPFKWRAG